MRPAALLLLATAPFLAAEPGPRWDNSSVAGAGLPSFEYEVVDYFPGLRLGGAVHTEAYSSPDGSRHLLFSSTLGTLHSTPINSPPDSPLPVLFDLKDRFSPQLRILSTLLESDLEKRPHLYLAFNTRKPEPRRNHVYRYPIESFSPLTLGEPTEILTWESGGHNAGDLAWGPDGMLYIAAGDRSAPGDPNNWGQRTDDIFGSILRIDVRGKTQPYGVPPDNPFVGMKNVRPEIWSYGLRNPWRFCFHPDNGELWVGDNGDESWELVHRIEKGANAGWSAFEGSAIFRPSNKLAGPTLTHTPAIVQHPHSEMRSVIGGIFYRGKALPKLRGRYLYGCYFTKRLWAFSYEDGKPGTPFLVADAGGQVVSITEDHDLEPIITCHDGKIFRLSALEETKPSPPWPATLSATGLFTDTTKEAPAPGVYTYLTNAKSWSDGADRNHFVAITDSDDGQMTPTTGSEAGRSWHVPTGSIVGQTLSLGGKKVETQLLHFDGTWRGYSYRWNTEETDATLVPESGLDAELDSQKWRFMSRAECLTCHTHRSNFTFSLSSAQLERPGADGATNQVDHFVALGLLKQNKVLERERGKPTPDPHDESFDLDTRARSYLHLNCAHCHRETGLGGRAGFQLLAGLSLEETGVIDAKPLVGITGNPDARVVAPGHPELSELLTRMFRRGAGQMPLIGSHAVDEQGVELIREWISSLEP